ncbi:MAG: adenylate kinase [Caldilineaceae bacterium]|nr:adenylate kinase [Caldilineaceae bacterium]MDE0182318.1 adenylate kinase [Caldilineaceae bacterium]
MSDRIYLVLLGAPGSGKGTQSQLLQEQLGIPQVSTGEIFRYNLKNETELGQLAKSYYDRGELVPDEVTIRMVEARLAEPDAARGAILDGFPRNLIQARALDGITEPHGGIALVPLIQLEDDVVSMRITGRRLCRDCDRVYHVTFNPPRGENCDSCGGVLYQREDDKPETVQNRLYVYYKQTSPLIGYYFAHGLLVEVDGEKSIEAMQEQLAALLVARNIGLKGSAVSA